MALKNLFFAITARDRTSAAFNAVNANLRQTAGLSASVGERVNRMGNGMLRVGAAGSVASAGIVAAFRDSVGLYDTQARAEAKVAQAINATGGAAGFTADELKKQASALQAVTRFGDEAILNGVTAQLLTFKNIAGDTFTRAQTAALDLATTLDGDLQSASIQLGKALNDPVAGLSAMSRAGVTFSESQKQMVKDMVASGDLLGAQTLILDEIASAYGGQAKAARDAGAGILDAWKNVWGDVKEIVGGEVLNLLRVVVPPLQSITKAFQDMSPEGQRVVVVIGALAAVLPPVIAAVGVLAIGLAAVTAPVWGFVAGVAAGTAAVVAFWPQIKATADFLSGSFTAVVDGTGAVVSWLGDTFMSVFGAIPKYVSDCATAVMGWITDTFNSALQSLGDKVEWVEGKFAWLYDKVVGNSWVPDLIDEIGKSFGMLSGNMVKPTDEAATSVNGTFKGLIGEVGSSLSDLATSGNLTWKGFLGSMLEVGNTYADRIISDVFDRIGSGMSGALSGVGMAGSMAGGAGGGAGGGGGVLGGIVGAGLGFARNLIGFDTGGEFDVMGRAGADRNVASVRLSQGEKVRVLKRGQSDDRRPVNVYIQTPNPQAFHASRAQIGAQISRAAAAGARAA